MAGFQKVTDAQIRLIRKDTRPLIEIANDYGVSKNFVSLVKRFLRRGDVK